MELVDKKYNFLKAIKTSNLERLGRKLDGGYVIDFEINIVDISNGNGESIRSYLDAGTNPPSGVVITYYLEDTPEGSLVLNFNNSSGELIRSFSNTFPSSTPVSANKGINQFIWDMKHQGPVSIRKDLGLNMMDPAVAVSASVPPGMYEVQLVVGDITVSQSFEILKDPRVSASQEDFEAQAQLLLDIRDKISETNMAINRLADVRNQAQEWGRLSQNFRALSHWLFFGAYARPLI